MEFFIRLFGRSGLTTQLFIGTPAVIHIITTHTKIQRDRYHNHDLWIFLVGMCRADFEKYGHQNEKNGKILVSGTKIWANLELIWADFELILGYFWVSWSLHHYF